MMESEGFNYGANCKKCPVGLVQFKIPGCNKCLHHTCQCELMTTFNINRDGSE